MAIAVGGVEERPLSDINVVPLTDVMLVLLIVFLITVPAALQQIEKLQIPVFASAESKDKAENLLVTVSTTDAGGRSAGEPGYVIPDEVWPGATHDSRGLLCMANRGPNTNGQQFFIMDAAAKHLDSGYTIFGKCGPDAVIEKLASVPVRGDHSVTPSKIKKVTIKRRAS